MLKISITPNLSLVTTKLLSAMQPSTVDMVLGTLAGMLPAALLILMLKNKEATDNGRKIV